MKQKRLKKELALYEKHIFKLSTKFFFEDVIILK